MFCFCLHVVFEGSRNLKLISNFAQKFVVLCKGYTKFTSGCVFFLLIVISYKMRLLRVTPFATYLQDVVCFQFDSFVRTFIDGMACY